MNRFRLLPRLVASYLLLGVGITFLSLLGGRWINGNAERQSAHRTELLQLVEGISVQLGSAAEESFSYMLLGDRGEADKGLARLEGAAASIRTLEADPALSSDERIQLARVSGGVAQLRAAALAMFRSYAHTGHVDPDDDQSFEEALDSSVARVAALNTGFLAGNDLVRAESNRRAEILTLWIGVLAVLLAAVFGTLVSLMITRPVLALRNAAVDFATKTLHATIPTSVGDEVTELKAVLGHMMAETARHITTIDQKAEELLVSNQTLLRETEERRKMEQEAKAANLAKSQFLANMSHEIRTPMTAIIGFGDLLLEADLSAEERTQHVKVIQRSGKHLLGLIDDILDLSKVESGKLVVERIPCSPRKVIVDVVSLLRVRALAKHLALHVVYATPIPATIQSDPTRLRQILVNVVSNAIKFTAQGAVTMTIRCPDPTGPAPSLVVDVSDTGPGIAVEQLGSVFEPFSQADASTTRKYGGTGLGLTISRRLAMALDGSLTLASHVGVGSTFTLTVGTGSLSGVAMLDDEREAGSSDTSPADPVYAGLEGHVLLAEDGVDNQVLISSYLRRAGAKVTVAENGRIALDWALRAREAGVPFDLILMDMQMPELDGYGATRALRAAGYTLPIVALTAHAMAGDRAKCIEAGCDGYFTKPIAREELGAVLHQYLRRSSADAAPLVSVFAGEDDMKRLIWDFVRNLERHANVIDAALAAGDVDGLRATAHQLRGAAGGYGFPILTDAATRLEYAIAEGADLRRLTPLTRSLTGLCRSARASVPPPGN